MTSIKEIQKVLNSTHYPDYWEFKAYSYGVNIKINNTVDLIIKPTSKGVILTDHGWSLEGIKRYTNQDVFKVLTQYQIPVKGDMIEITCPLSQLTQQITKVIECLTQLGYDNLQQTQSKDVSDWFNKLNEAIDATDDTDTMAIQSIPKLTKYENFQANDLIDTLKTLVNNLDYNLKYHQKP